MAVGGLSLVVLSSAMAQEPPHSTAQTASAIFDHVSCRGAPNEIRLVITGVEDAVGQIAADLYPNDQAKFLKGSQRIKQVRFAARTPQTAFCISAPEAGDYAIALYHDRNANKDLDKNSFGLPNEPWGISNNPKVRFSAPTVDKAIFPVSEDGAEVEITLR